MRRYSVTIGGQKQEIGVEDAPAGAAAGSVRVEVGGRERLLELRQLGTAVSWLDGTRVVIAEVQASGGQAAGGQANAVSDRRKLTVTVGGETVVAEVADVAVELAAALGARAGRAVSGPATVRAPMPGRVVKLLARAGDEVKAGQGLMVVEAMKMENEIRAPRAGRLAQITVADGAAVESGEPLAVIE